jgi:hypothetical protein
VKLWTDMREILTIDLVSSKALFRTHQAHIERDVPSLNGRSGRC